MFDFTLFKISLKGLMANKVRTSLTVLGIVVGIAATITVFSAGEGVRGLILQEIEGFGSNIIITEIKIPSEGGMAEGGMETATGLAGGSEITTMTLDDVEDLKKIPNIVDGYGAIMNQGLVSYEGQRKNVTLMGVNASYINIDNSQIDEGRFFSDSEDRSMDSVAVIGSEIKKDFFGQSNAIGESIRIGGSNFRVIGTIKERGAYAGVMDFDSYIYVPVRTLQERIAGINHIIYMVHQLEDPDQASQTAEQMRSILRENRDIKAPYDPESGRLLTHKDDFLTMTMDEMMEMIDVVTNALTFLLISLVSISLVVGGVGIMNIMYVIVNERTREIGLRKAVGARKKDILTQFLIESVLITLLGGLLGVLIGILISYSIYYGANSFGLDWNFLIPIRAYWTALIFSVVCGILFGLYPAKKASELDPIAALRKE